MLTTVPAHHELNISYYTSGNLEHSYWFMVHAFCFSYSWSCFNKDSF